MSETKVETRKVADFLEPSLVHNINHIVTEGKTKDGEDVGILIGGNEEALVNFSDEEGGDGVEISREEDHHTIMNEGVTEGIRTRLRYEFGEEADIIDISSFVMEVIAKNQAYGDGNKRTSYVTGVLIIAMYQIVEQDSLEIYTPGLTEDFVDLISNVAIDHKEEDRHDIAEYLGPLKESLCNKEN